MGSIKKLLVLVSVLLLVLVSCGGAAPSNVERVPPAEIYFTILADQNLSIDNKEAILLAIDEWHTQTNFDFQYTLEFTDMTEQPEDTHVDHVIKVYVQPPGPGLVGWTEWQVGNWSANILILPTLDPDNFRKVMLHELGHAFNLRFLNNDIHYHGPYQSVMYPSIERSSEHLSCPELEAFCSAYNCRTPCLDRLPDISDGG